MKIVVISQYFWPEPASIPGDVAQALSDSGFDVKVITSFPQYPYGSIYKGYRQGFRYRESRGGYSIHRVAGILNHSPRPVFRALNYLTFALGLVMWIDILKRADVIYVYGAPLTAGFIPFLLRVFRGPPYVVHAVDVWPDTFIFEPSSESRSAMRESFLRLARFVFLGVYKRGSAVIAVTESNQKLFEERGIDPGRIKLVYNWATAAAERSGPLEKRVNKANRRRFIYGGNLGQMQGLEVLLDAVKMVNDRGLDFDVVIAGDGTEAASLRNQAEQLGLENVVFTGQVSEDGMTSLYQDSDFSFVLLRDRQLFRGTLPSKIPTLLCFGVPIITNIAGEAQRLVQRNGVGLTVEPASAQDLARIITVACGMSDKDIRKMSQRASSFYHDTMTREKSIGLLEALLADVATKG